MTTDAMPFASCPACGALVALDEESGTPTCTNGHRIFGRVPCTTEPPAPAPPDAVPSAAEPAPAPDGSEDRQAAMGAKTSDRRTPGARLAPVHQPPADFGPWLRDQRLARKWSHTQLAARAGVHPMTISKVERGKMNASRALQILLRMLLRDTNRT